jgi:hypothetical protein
MVAAVMLKKHVSLVIWIALALGEMTVIFHILPMVFW